MAKKYIDADLLRKEIGFAKSVYSNPERVVLGVADAYRQDGRAAMCEDILKKLNSLQQEQPAEKTCKDCGFYDNNCPYIRGKFIPYPSKVCKDYTYSVIKAQEQPTEDLKGEIREWVDLMVGASFPEQDGDYISEEDYRSVIRQTALHFYELGKQSKEPVSEDLEKAAESYCVEICNYAVDSLEADTAIDAFIEGAKWQKEQKMKDAWEREVKIDSGGYPYIDITAELYDYEHDVPLAKEGELVKIIIVKGD